MIQQRGHGENVQSVCFYLRTDPFRQPPYVLRLNEKRVTSRGRGFTGIFACMSLRYTVSSGTQLMSARRSIVPCGLSCYEGSNEATAGVTNVWYHTMAGSHLSSSRSNKNFELCSDSAHCIGRSNSYTQPMCP